MRSRGYEPSWSLFLVLICPHESYPDRSLLPQIVETTFCRTDNAQPNYRGSHSTLDSLRVIRHVCPQEFDEAIRIMKVSPKGGALSSHSRVRQGLANDSQRLGGEIFAVDRIKSHSPSIRAATG